MLKRFYYGSDIFYVLLFNLLIYISYVPRTLGASVTTWSEAIWWLTCDPTVTRCEHLRERLPFDFVLWLKEGSTSIIIYGLGWKPALLRKFKASELQRKNAHLTILDLYYRRRMLSTPSAHPELRKKFSPFIEYLYILAYIYLKF